MAQLAWHGFAFALPEGWEVTGYRTDPVKGEFRFHRRLDEQGQLVWVRMAAQPDLQRILAGIHEQQGGAIGDLRTRRIGAFLLGHGDPGRPAQAVSWVGHDARLLHWTFPAWDPALCERDWMPLLQSLSATAGDQRDWELFGLRLRLPRTWQVRVEEAQPGSVTLRASSPGCCDLRATRLGLAGLHLARRSPDRLLRSLLFPEDARIDTCDPVGLGSWAGAVASYRIRSPRVRDRLLWRQWRGDARLWHRADENRIYCLDQRGPSTAPRLDLAHVVPA